MNREMAARLRDPFPATKIGHLPRVICSDCAAKDRTCKQHKTTVCKTCKAYIGKHTHLDFVGHADVTDRLLEVDPEWGWEPLAVGENGMPVTDGNGGLWIKLTVGGKTRLGYGHAGSKRGGDAVKETIGDAIRNAAMRFGVALDMWRKETPEPVQDNDTARQPEQTEQTEPVDRPAQLRAVIAQLGRQRGWDITTTAAEFLDWSRGRAIQEATVAELAEYIDFLQKVKE